VWPITVCVLQVDAAPVDQMQGVSMVSRLDQAFAFHEQATRLRVQRHEMLSANIANADTPDYKARDIDFKNALQQAMTERGVRLSGGGSHAPTVLATTSARHLSASGSAARPSSPPAHAEALYRTVQQASIDGNTVDMDVERMQFMNNTMHYDANMTFLSSRIKSLMSAIQG
jgi:flagellar basal-body rod protein FlgB